MTNNEWVQVMLLTGAVVFALAVCIAWWWSRWAKLGQDDIDPFMRDDPDRWPVSVSPDGTALSDKGWTVQVTYSARAEDGALIQARTVYWAEAASLPGAYAEAREAFAGQSVKFGACLPGHHARVP